MKVCVLSDRKRRSMRRIVTKNKIIAANVTAEVNVVLTKSVITNKSEKKGAPK